MPMFDHDSLRLGVVTSFFICFRVSSGGCWSVSIYRLWSQVGNVECLLVVETDPVVCDDVTGRSTVSNRFWDQGLSGPMYFFY